MSDIKAVAKQAALEEIESVDSLLSILERVDLTDEQKHVIPFLWFQYTVRDASHATSISQARIRQWLNDPTFYEIVEIGRARKREILSKYLYQAGLLGFHRIMEFLMRPPGDDIKVISEQQKSARFVVGELKMEPEKLQHQVDARVLDIAEDVEGRIAEVVSGRTIDTMPKLLTLPCVEQVHAMACEPRRNKMHVYYTGDDLLLQCHECEGWFADLESHIEQHNMTPREYCAEYDVSDEVFNLVEFVEQQ